MAHQVFDQSVGVILDIRTWSGSKKLKDEDFAGVELPPEELVSLGSKRIHNRETLKPIQAVRTRAVSVLESVAVSLYGGKVWLMPEHKTDEVESALAGLAEAFETEKHRFLDNFEAQQQAWLEQNSRWASILEPYLETAASVESKFGFSWRTFRIGPAGDDNLADTVSDDVTHCLLREVSTLAAEAYDTLKDRDRATPKNLGRLDRLAYKLRGLSFVDPGVGAIEDELRYILDMRDADGVLAGTDVYHLARLLVQLKNPQVLDEVLDAARNGNTYRFVYDVAETQPLSTRQPRLPDAWF